MAVVGRQWRVKPVLETVQATVWLGAGRADGDGIHLGSLAEVVRGKTPSVWLATGKEHVTAVVGKRGSGKSFTLGVLIEGFTAGTDTCVGRQQHPRAALMFDPLDIYWTTKFGVAESANLEANRHFTLAKGAGLLGLNFDVVAWVPGSSNRRRADPDWFRALVLAVPSLGIEEWELLLGVNAVHDPMGQLLTDTVQLVKDRGYSLDGQFSEPASAYGLTDLASALAADELAGIYHGETVRALRQRLGSLEATGLFAARGTGIQQLVTPGRASVILLNRLPQSYRDVVVAVVTRMLVDARSATTFAEKRLVLDPDLTVDVRRDLEKVVEQGVPRTVVLLDEAQTFLSPSSSGSTRELFVRLVKEGRNMGLSAVVATQQPSALDRRILSQVETFIAHQLVTEQDIRAVRENLKSSLPQSIQFGQQDLDEASLLRQLPPGICFVSSADMNSPIRRSIIVAVRPRATIHGGIEI